LEAKKIRLLIDSDLSNVALVGLTINRLCGLVPSGKVDPYSMELCVVEAVNNCIEHAYQNRGNREIEVVFELVPDRLVVRVCDRGRMMDKDIFAQKSTSPLDVNDNDLKNLNEQGRGLAIIKQIMDQVSYESVDGRNCLTMIKFIT
jgi:anti-sigma regulatory factor (Ser/Thr protein kinase)